MTLSDPTQHSDEAIPRSAPIGPELADAWVAKGVRMAAPLLAAVGRVAAPTGVVARAAAPDQAPYGRLMVCWPEAGVSTSTVWHIGDGGLFLDHLKGCYRALLGADEAIDRALADESRLEMACTNDVLQVQLPDGWSGYSMVRNHALMLLHGLLWLDEPARSRWAQLYSLALERQLELGLPAWDEIEGIEQRAFEWYRKVAPATQSSEAQEVLEAGASGDAARYQQLAAAAIGMLWREHDQCPPGARDEWQIRELSEGYGDRRYLVERWERLRSAGR